jgi:hypothetical protein
MWSTGCSSKLLCARLRTRSTDRLVATGPRRFRLLRSSSTRARRSPWSIPGRCCFEILGVSGPQLSLGKLSAPGRRSKGRAWNLPSAEPADRGRFGVWGRLGSVSSSPVAFPRRAGSWRQYGCEMHGIEIAAEWWLGCCVRARSGRGVGRPRPDRHAAPCEN